MLLFEGRLGGFEGNNLSQSGGEPLRTEERRSKEK
jgi:hypothetical protein